jgi:hypothetical protein
LFLNLPPSPFKVSRYSGKGIAMPEEKVVMYESSEAASIQTVTGWVGADGRFWGNDEHMARYCGATHRHCEKNPDHPIYEVRSWPSVTAMAVTAVGMFEAEKPEWKPRKAS